MKNILSKIASLQNNKIVFWLLQALWFGGAVSVLLITIGFSVELFNAADFEYYGYEVMPWYYHNIWISRQYFFIIIIFLILCLAYSLHFRRKNTFLAILILVLPFIYFHIQVSLLDING